MRVLLPLAILTAFLTACATGVSECPSLYAYTLEEQQQAADELDDLRALRGKGGVAIDRMLADYRAVRNEIRVCRGEPPLL